MDVTITRRDYTGRLVSLGLEDAEYDDLTKALGCILAEMAVRDREAMDII